MRKALARPVIVVLVLTLVLAVLLGGLGLWAWRSTRDVSVTWGTCYGWISQHCVDVPLAGISTQSRLAFPAGTRVVSSSSTGPGFTGRGQIQAEIALPIGAQPPVPVSRTVPPGFRVPDSFAEVKRRGYTGTAFFAGTYKGSGYLAIAQGKDSRGHVHVLLTIDVDGRDS